MMMATIMVIGISALFFFWYASTFNGLIASRNAAEQSWSNVEVDLTRRLDLIGNLVETVKGYAKHESETLEKVIAARGQGAAAVGPAGASATEGAITSAVRGLLAVAEQYPNLKADANFRELQGQLTETENRIADRRNMYNQTANAYKNLCEKFPSVFIASMHGFQPKPFFDVPDELVARAPQVQFT